MVSILLILLRTYIPAGEDEKTQWLEKVLSSVQKMSKEVIEKE